MKVKLHDLIGQNIKNKDMSRSLPYRPRYCVVAFFWPRILLYFYETFLCVQAMNVWRKTGHQVQRWRPIHPCESYSLEAYALECYSSQTELSECRFETSLVESSNFLLPPTTHKWKNITKSPRTMTTVVPAPSTSRMNTKSNKSE